MLRFLAICLLFIGICYPSPAQQANPFDILIDEIFFDPIPVFGLPNGEFIELKNRSSHSFDLRNWQIGYGSQESTIKINFILEPDSFLILCTNSGVAAYTIFGKTIGMTGFPTLNNEGQTIYLKSPEGLIIHALAYEKSWYQNELKAEGGWSIEMIDPGNPCGGASNWRASSDPSGGTPGSINSVNGQNPDEIAPKLTRTISEDSASIVLIFDEPLDPVSASTPGNYTIDPMGQPISANPIPPLNQSVRLQLPSAMAAGLVYHVSASGLMDCSGNLLASEIAVPAGLPSEATAMDLVINEILFNPPTNGYDYVEIYNRSKKIIDLSHWALANRGTDGSLNNLVSISEVHRLIFPGDYLVFSENGSWVTRHYLVKNPENILDISSLPSLPDEEGALVLLNSQGLAIDEIHYEHNWHFALLANEEGVSLERLNFNQPTQDRANWGSAASTAGFGTPGYKNSAFEPGTGVDKEISIHPRTFSPDNDGIDDYCYIAYHLPQAGFAGNITIFEASGRPARYLLRNGIFGTEGMVRWDGLDDQLHALAMGIYVIYVELYNLKGEVKTFRQALVLVRKQ